MVSGEKRNCEDENVLEGVTTILLDIEGTTTSISYVKDVLFPYVRENLKTYVDAHWDDDEFKADLEALKKQAKKDEEDKIENFCPIEEGEKEKESLIKNVLWQMDLDRKTTALKQLQGHVWREGYENGKLKGHVFDDVAQIFKKWCEEGRKLYIYSSGSVEAQKLLFKHSESGDLQSFISGYFDTEIGPKTEAVSYTNIAKAVECDACKILFITDVMKEATAADKAGMQVMIAIREGNAPLSDSDLKSFTTIKTFKDVVLENSNKKKKICEEECIRQCTEKTENVEESNGEAEKMEVETSEGKAEEAKQEKTEENGQSKTETESPEGGESENIDVDVDDSNAATEAEEKVVSSSVEDKKESSETKEASKESKEESADSTNESAPVAEGEKENGEAKPEETNEAKEEEKKESVNGHENGDHKEEEKEGAKEVKNGEANGKMEEEEVEAVPVKKIAKEDQADSTVEVTA